MNSNSNRFLPGPGYDQYQVPIALFEENRLKLATRLSRAFNAGTTTVGTTTTTARVKKIVIVKGGISPLRYDTDHEPIFRQESYFWWLTGVKEPDCTVVISILIDIIGDGDGDGDGDGQPTPIPTTTIHTTLFVPQLPCEYATIMGKIRTLAEWKEMYGFDEVLYTHEIEKSLVNDNQMLCGIAGTGTTTTTTTVAAAGDDDDNESDTVSCQILLLKGPNSDSKLLYDENTVGIGEVFSSQSNSSSSSSVFYQKCLNNNIIDTTTLFPILADCRTIKSPLELQLLEHVTQITSFAHAYVMRNMTIRFGSKDPDGRQQKSKNLKKGKQHPPLYEYQCESLFKHYTYYNYGSRFTAYTSICGCGPNSAILHYGHTGEPNARKIIHATDHCLFDMGAEYQCYASDITCSFPANGTFTPKYKAIYESVLNAQRAVFKLMAPGVSYVECHIAAELEIVKGLYNIGIVQIPASELGDVGLNTPGMLDKMRRDINTKLETLVRDHRLGAVFMPHGLGHLIGIDTHDVGGYLQDYTDSTTKQPLTPPRIEQPGLKSLRTARILQPNMVVTVEPGCYFIDHLLDEAFQSTNVLSNYLNQELINSEYRGYGGVRLEDVVTLISTKKEHNNAKDDDHDQGNGNNNKNENGNKKQKITSSVSASTSSSSSCNKNKKENENKEYYLHNFTLCPRTVNEVEYVMSGGKWPPMKDDAPELCRLKLTDTTISPLPAPPSI